MGGWLDAQGLGHRTDNVECARLRLRKFVEGPARHGDLRGGETGTRRAAVLSAWAILGVISLGLLLTTAL